MRLKTSFLSGYTSTLFDMHSLKRQTRLCLFCNLNYKKAKVDWFDLSVYYDLSFVQIHNALYKFLKSHWISIDKIALHNWLRWN